MLDMQQVSRATENLHIRRVGVLCLISFPQLFQDRGLAPFTDKSRAGEANGFAQDENESQLQSQKPNPDSRDAAFLPPVQLAQTVKLTQCQSKVKHS